MKSKLIIFALSFVIVIGFLCRSCQEANDYSSQEIDDLTQRALVAAGGGSIQDVRIVIAPAWELECGGSCIHYDRRLIEVASGERWRQDLMHEVTHWALWSSGIPAGTHHPIMIGRGICYGGCDDVPTADPHKSSSREK